LLAASQPSTLVKTEPPATIACSVPIAATSINNNAGEMAGSGDAIRFLSASGPLLTSGGIGGFPHPMEHEAAFRAAAIAQGALPFPAIYPGLHAAHKTVHI
uniref:Ketoacyl_synth_N domain-containing protein n=1 Tax=Gongylonema pulchrum TaxID=637853 RepID=A0A183DA49_9BILA